MPPIKHRRSYGTLADLKSYIRQSGSYHSQNENRVIHDIQECARSFPSLYPILDDLVAMDGKAQQLLALRGTIPISYKGGVYKIPIHMWIMPYHPAGPPLVYVVPTRTMVFRQRHPHVDSKNGLVYMPYLSSWDALTSSVSGTVNAMIQVFSIKPPVYSRETPASTLQDEVDRQRLIKEVSDRLSAELARNTAAAKRTVHRMLSFREDLKQEEDVRQSRRRQISRNRVELEAVEQDLRQKLHDLRRWRELHPDTPSGSAIDDITRPRTALREQMIDCGALDAAQTDTLDQIDEALATGVIENEAYLRAVRKVAREQFFTRALQLRVQQQIAGIEKPEETTTGVVPVQQVEQRVQQVARPPIQSPMHQRQRHAKPIHTTYRPRTGT